MVSCKVNLSARNTTSRGPLRVINSITISTCEDAVDVEADDNLDDVLLSKVNVSSDECDRVISEAITRETNPASEDIDPELFDENFETDFNEMLMNNGDMVSTRRKMVDSATLADRWGIDPGKAKNTIRRTTQRGVRTCLHPSLARRFPTNDRMLRYDRLPHTLFTDTMFSAGYQRAAINVRNPMAHPMDGAGCTQWSQRARPTRRCPRFSCVTEYLLRWLLMALRSRGLDALRRSARRQIAI